METTYPYSIGSLARMAKVSVQAIRLYERKGLLKPLKRRPSGYRVYDVAAFLRIETIKQLKRVGFTLAEMREIFAEKQVLWRNPKMRQAMQRKLKEVRQRIEELRLLEAGLQDWTRQRTGPARGRR